MVTWSPRLSTFTTKAWMPGWWMGSHPEIIAQVGNYSPIFDPQGRASWR
jgi:hypothetical protein